MHAVLWIESAQGKYAFSVGTDLLNAALLRPVVSLQSVVILSHPEIAAHYLAPLQAACTEAGAVRVVPYLIPSGEVHKTLATVEQVWSFLLNEHFHRDTVIVALGGGMLGDIAGFTAACYLRGVPFIQIPTTLLAQIDASIGAKTGVNHPLGKNVIGAFYAPVMVLADLQLLSTLPQREFCAGLAELIKYGLANDRDFFDWLELHMHAIVRRDQEALFVAIEWAARCKARIVAQDEKENDLRRVLNFGHTIAHALENLLQYQHWLHGEAVAVGMLVAVAISVEQGLSRTCVDRLVNLLTVAGLPLALPENISVAKVLVALKQDKKHRQQKLSWVLLRDVGQAEITQAVSVQAITAALKAYGAQS